MKTLLALLMLALSPHSEAAKDLILKNKAGGDIVFTETAANCDGNTKFAYIRESGGEIKLTGCWFYDSENEKVFVRWGDGTSYVYK